QAYYFRAVTDLLDGHADAAQKSLDALLAWQRANLPPDQTSQQGASAAAAILQYRVHALQAENAPDPQAKQQANAAAVETLTKLLKDRPDLQGTINELLVSKLPENANLGAIDPLLLNALLRRGQTEALRPEGERADEKILRRAIDAANEIIRRQNAAGANASNESVEH